MSKFPSKLITIEAVSDKEENRKAAIKGTDGNWYNIWKDFEDEPTIEYGQLKNGNHGASFKKGDQAIISVKESEYNGKPQYTIKSIFPTDGGAGAPEQPKAQNAAPRATQSAREPSKETDWDQIAVGKCQTAFLAAYLQAGNTFADAKLQAVQARKLAELVVYGTQVTTAEDLPTINQDDDPAGDFNPMVNDELPGEVFGQDIPY
jgi:hypothetical protein